MAMIMRNLESCLRGVKKLLDTPRGGQKRLVRSDARMIRIKKVGRLSVILIFFSYFASRREKRVMGMIARIRVSLTMDADSRVLV